MASPSISIIDIINLTVPEDSRSIVTVIENSSSTMTLTNWTRSSSKLRKLAQRKRSLLSWYSNGSGSSDSRNPLHLNQVSDTFSPMKIILQILGRFPFNSIKFQGPDSKTENTGEQRAEEAARKIPEPYTPSLLSLHWLYFALSSTFLLVVFLLVSLGFVRLYLEWDFPGLITYSFSDREKDIFNGNLVPYVLFWSCLFHSNVGSVSYVRNRKRIVCYLNEWEIFIRDLNIVLPTSLKTFLIASNLWFIAFLIMVVLFYVYRILPIAVGGAELIGILCLKPFYENVYENDWFWEISILSVVILVYSMYTSRALLFMYAYKCRLHRLAFKMWNKRLTELLRMCANNYVSEEEMLVEERKSCERLYEDHYNLTAMIKRTDKIFGGVLQSYYACQILNMCFELYYLAQAGHLQTKNQDVILGAILLLLQNISIFFTVSLDAAYVQDEAHKGVEILRKRGILPGDSISKKYLINNLSISYCNRIVMTGGKFFAIDRPFIITILGAVCTYFVIILQFGDKLPFTENFENSTTS